MTEHDFLEYAGTLTNQEIDIIIFKLNQIKENREYKKHFSAEQKVKDAINNYLKLGGHISIEREVQNQGQARYGNVEATFNDCFEKGDYLIFTFEE